MKKLLIITMIASVMIMGGCASKVENSNENYRFVDVMQFKTSEFVYDIMVMKDTETHILYLCTPGGGITPWLDADGKPMKAGE